ncbi:MAG: electron transfer flavoprotein subunit beta, partial [Desulfohalobiaceae bacterium]
DKSKLLLFGGWQSASRGTGAVMQIVGEILGIHDQFQGVDALVPQADGSLEVKERVEGGSYLISALSGPPAVLGWATGSLPEPPNNPQVGMQNMRLVMPALQKAAPAPVGAEGVTFATVERPGHRRETRIVKDTPVEEIAREIAEWVKS